VTVTNGDPVGQWLGQAAAASGYGFTGDPPPGWNSKCRCGELADAFPLLPT
jgi:hypothetical protein